MKSRLSRCALRVDCSSRDECAPDSNLRGAAQVGSRLTSGTEKLSGRGSFNASESGTSPLERLAFCSHFMLAGRRLNYPALVVGCRVADYRGAGMYREAWGRSRS